MQVNFRICNCVYASFAFWPKKVGKSPVLKSKSGQSLKLKLAYMQAKTVKNGLKTAFLGLFWAFFVLFDELKNSLAKNPLFSHFLIHKEN